MYSCIEAKAVVERRRESEARDFTDKKDQSMHANYIPPQTHNTVARQRNNTNTHHAVYGQPAKGTA